MYGRVGCEEGGERREVLGGEEDGYGEIGVGGEAVGEVEEGQHVALSWVGED